MAHDASARARLFSELSRSRPSSPYDDNVYMTATGTSFQNILHSTPLRGESSPYALPENQNRLPEASEYDSDSSTDASIEIGRGNKRRSPEHVSSEGIFNLGNEDSQYEVSMTPPTRNAQRKTEASLRKEASRRAADLARTNVKTVSGGVKGRSVSETLPKTYPESNRSFNARDFAQNIAPPRNTRFVGFRQPSVAESRQPSASGFALPTRFVSGKGFDYTSASNIHTTVQSATVTAEQSFALPDITGINELVSDIPKRTSRSRFTSGSYQPRSHRPVESLPVPDDEKVIVQSLQTFRDRISELEAEKMDNHKQIKQLKEEVNDSRNKANSDQHAKASSANDETVSLTMVIEAADELMATLKTVQGRRDRSARKVFKSQVLMQRMVQERDALISQLEEAHREIEELSKENQELKAARAGEANRSQSVAKERATKKEREGIAMEVDLPSSAKDSRRDSKPVRLATSRSRSKSRNRSSMSGARRRSSPLRTASAPAELDVSDAESTTELTYEVPNKATPVQVGSDQDMTILSDLDDDIVVNLRKNLEEERRVRNTRKNASSANAVSSNAVQKTRRRSSLKCVNEVLNDGTGRFSIRAGISEDATKTGRTVRVQSPHTSDATIQASIVEPEAGDISILSNTSRRRRRKVSSTEGMTSAFIIPDITIQSSMQLGQSCINHKASNCTICHKDDKNLTIPTPIPASERMIAEDVTDATIRPAQPPALALATVIKQLEDEITHIKFQHDAQTRLYHRHDPAISQRQRLRVKAKLDALTAGIEKRSGQVYALYDVIEGQKQQQQQQQQQQQEQHHHTQGRKSSGQSGMSEEEIEETLLSIGIDPVEISGKIARSVSAAAELDGSEEWSGEDEDEHPWEGLSDDNESEM